MIKEEDDDRQSNNHQTLTRQDKDLNKTGSSYTRTKRRN